MAQRGRPRGFDRGDALLKAMRVFWARGYEGTTLTDLQEAMGGITAPSFYAAFGSKEKLFRETVELYNNTLGTPMMAALGENRPARDSIQAVLEAAVEAFCKPDAPRGCLFVLAAINSTPTTSGIVEYLRGLRTRRQKAIEQRLRRAQEEHELPEAADARALAAFFTTVIDGLAIQARDGASLKTLRFAVDCAMAAYDSQVNSEPRLT